MPKNSWYRIQAAANGREATIDVYDEIGFWGITAADFRKELTALGKIDTIHLHISSPGGSVFDCLAIFNTLVNHPAKVITHIDGLAASCASWIAMAADEEVLIAENGFFMIHNPMQFVFGEAEDLRRYADLLDKITGQCVAAYQRHTDLDEERILELMDAETWMTAAEAVELGFATKVTKELAIAASAAGAAPSPFDFKSFDRVPEAAQRFFRNQRPETGKESAMSGTQKPAPTNGVTNTPPAPEATPTNQPNPDPVQGAAGDPLAADRRALEQERLATRTELLAARRERFTAEVDREIEALGSRVTPGMIRAGLRSALIELRMEAGSESPSTFQHSITMQSGEVQTTEITPYAAVLETLKALPEFTALGAGELAGNEAEAGAQLARDRRSDAERKIHARHGLTDERFAELAAKYPGMSSQPN